MPYHQVRNGIAHYHIFEIIWLGIPDSGNEMSLHQGCGLSFQTILANGGSHCKEAGLVRDYDHDINKCTLWKLICIYLPTHIRTSVSFKPTSIQSILLRQTVHSPVAVLSPGVKSLLFR